MGRTKQPYTLIKPEIKGGPYLYRMGYDTKRPAARSTGKTTRREAILYCEDMLKNKGKSDPSLKEYTKDFYIIDKCPYAASRRRTGKPVDERTLGDERSRLENYILPAFGDIKLKDLSPVHWDHWLEDIESGKVLTKGLHPHKVADGTVNRIRRTLIQILDIAKRHGIVQTNVIRDTDPMSQSTYKPRDTLEPEDIKRLFPEDKAELLKIWKSDERVALYSLFLTSGLRSGEIQALRWHKISFEDGGIIVDKAIKYSGKSGATKTDTPRVLILPKQTLAHLKCWYDATPKKGDDNYLFYNRKGDDHVRGDSVLHFFKRVLKQQGFDPKRNLVVHSFRHTFTTALAEKMPIEDVMAFTGHKSASMIARYSHPNYASTLKTMKMKYDSQVAAIWQEKLGQESPSDPVKSTPDPDYRPEEKIELIGVE
ncbi:MAG: tyrosine-type recombinase/integrase [Spirochaetales bacterium]|nr:tyrosine-type recombinase/integrase [Spirochaetales bacterium]